MPLAFSVLVQTKLWWKTLFFLAVNFLSLALSLSLSLSHTHTLCMYMRNVNFRAKFFARHNWMFFLCYFFTNFFPSSEETSFLTTSYGLYFSHHYTQITHYKSSYAQGLGFHSMSTICQSAEYISEFYIHIQIRIIQLLIFTEKSSPLPGFEPGTSPVPSQYAINWAILAWMENIKHANLNNLGGKAQQKKMIWVKFNIFECVFYRKNES